MKPLYTKRGSKIWYSRFGIGKQIGSKIYFHKSVWDKIVLRGNVNVYRRGN